MRPHSLTWYDMTEACFTQEQWYSNFRVTVTTFAYIFRLILGTLDHRSMKAIVASTDHDFPLFLQRVASELVEQDAIFQW